MELVSFNMGLKRKRLLVVFFNYGLEGIRLILFIFFRYSWESSFREGKVFGLGIYSRFLGF